MPRTVRAAAESTIELYNPKCLVIQLVDEYTKANIFLQASMIHSLETQSNC
jgi:hypothetical protein